MKAIERAIQILGGPQEAENKLDVSREAIRLWRLGHRMRVDMAKEIEKQTGVSWVELIEESTSGD